MKTLKRDIKIEAGTRLEDAINMVVDAVICKHTDSQVKAHNMNAGMKVTTKPPYPRELIEELLDKGHELALNATLCIDNDIWDAANYLAKKYDRFSGILYDRLRNIIYLYTDGKVGKNKVPAWLKEVYEEFICHQYRMRYQGATDGAVC